ncbi:MAG TPA: hypothetical protein VIX12_08535 [Candidatus Binataceae bacterium]
MSTSINPSRNTVEGTRGVFLTIMAVLIAILAVSDFTKALQHIRDPNNLGLVILGIRLDTVGTNIVGGNLFGLMLATYAFGIWRMRSWVLPLSMAYAFYVPINLTLFWFLHIGQRPSVGFILVYLAVSLTGSVGTALYLAYHHDRLG